MRTYLVASLITVCAVQNTSAEMLTQDLRYSYSRSGGPASANVSQLPAPDFPHPSYSFVFSPTPAQSSSYQGRLNVEFEDQVEGPGPTQITLSLDPVTAAFREFGGQSATVGLGINPFNSSQALVSVSAGLSYDTRSSGRPDIGRAIHGSDTGIASGLPGLGIPFVLEAIVAPSLTVDTDLRFTGLAGNLLYRNRDTGDGGSIPFSLGSADRTLNLELDDPGLYDFSIVSTQLGNSLTRTSRVGIGFDIELFGGGLLENPPVINFTQASNSRTLPFHLNSADHADLQNWFSIDVHQVPEPSTMALALCGTVALTFFGRRRLRRRAC